MNFRTKRTIWVLLFITGAVVSISYLLNSPNAVAWFAAIIANAVGLVSFHFGNKPGSDVGLLNIINMSLGVVSCLISLGQWLFAGESGPEVLVVSAAFIAVWVTRPVENA